MNIQDWLIFLCLYNISLSLVLKKEKHDWKNREMKDNEFWFSLKDKKDITHTESVSPA